MITMTFAPELAPDADMAQHGAQPVTPAAVTADQDQVRATEIGAGRSPSAQAVRPDACLTQSGPFGHIADGAEDSLIGEAAADAAGEVDSPEQRTDRDLYSGE
ncbi:hypothetical protein [Streptosporangium sp. NPDC023615]|uniref:hypothetical protein n=1 Tax=Streptosporangium sp. NPDC023615 TaxID=3154794 RepID=UPI0034323619